jgi:hypothetical protein
MSCESREYASGYLGAVSRGLAASELTRGGLSGELLSPLCQYTPYTNTTPYDKRQPPLFISEHESSPYVLTEMNFIDLYIVSNIYLCIDTVDALYYDGHQDVQHNSASSVPHFPLSTQRPI